MVKQKNLYQKIVEEAIMDCYGEDEQISGRICIFDDNMSTPSSCTIWKEKVVLERIGTNDNSNVVIGIIKLDKTMMKVCIHDVILDNQKECNYIDAYTYWYNGID
jgi:hypothetical protein